MAEHFGGNAYLVIALLVFVTVLLLLEAAYLVWRNYKGPEARKIEQRLRALSASADTTAQAQLLKERMLGDVPALERLLLGLPRAHRLDRLIVQSGLDWSVSRLLVSCAVVAVGAFAVAMLALHQPPLVAAAAAALLGALPLLYVQYRRSRRMMKLQLQLPEAIDLVTRALRAGHSFAAGMQMIGEEMAEPIANEFRIVADEVNFGVSLQQALTNLSERVPLTDLRYFVVAVMIQRESGGNLTEVLSNLSRLIRERLKLLAKVRVLSSEGRLSGWILVVMPFALAAVMNLVNPQFMSVLWTDPIGIAIVEYMLGLMAVGVLIMRKIIRIRV
ncbi:type II secretion system F family protein [Variovorax defluvii]|uniref:Type II secretion system F family protein n=1 Tax=Variovorax defluvii TaxID=913761 RepID=A0ABP8HFZ7_9BURK